jgi:hypothetical protein
MYLVFNMPGPFNDPSDCNITAIRRYAQPNTDSTCIFVDFRHERHPRASLDWIALVHANRVYPKCAAVVCNNRAKLFERLEKMFRNAKRPLVPDVLADWKVIDAFRESPSVSQNDTEGHLQ